MEKVMAELSERFARDKLGSDTSKAVLAERMRAEARTPTRDAIAVRRPRAWVPRRLQNSDGHQEKFSASVP